MTFMPSRYSPALQTLAVLLQLLWTEHADSSAPLELQLTANNFMAISFW